MRTLSVFVSAVCAVFFCCALPGSAAESYPARPVRLFIPFVPGGSTDFVARVMQPGLVEALGQPIVLDNRPGASGNIAVELTDIGDAKGCAAFVKSETALWSDIAGRVGMRGTL